MRCLNNRRTWSAVVVFFALQCGLFGAAANAVTINFDTFPDGAPVPEGTRITDQYASVGVIFGIADTSFPPDALVIEDASADINTFTGMSLPNVLTAHGFSPGPGGSLGCAWDLKLNFIDPSTQLSATVSSASILVFAQASSPPNTIHLIAIDLDGNIVDQDEFTITTANTTLAFTLSVSAPEVGITTIQTRGVTGNSVCTAFDNLTFIPRRIEVSIDIKPGEFPNSINPRSQGVIPVAILTTDTFDATTVNASTVRFGKNGTEAPPVQSAVEDVNGDGLSDLILHFNTQATGIQCGDTSASLTGMTFSGQAIQGSDSIVTVGCR
jgi:hypothetical protein